MCFSFGRKLNLRRTAKLWWKEWEGLNREENHWSNDTITSIIYAKKEQGAMHDNSLFPITMLANPDYLLVWFQKDIRGRVHLLTCGAGQPGKLETGRLLNFIYQLGIKQMSYIYKLKWGSIPKPIGNRRSSSQVLYTHSSPWILSMWDKPHFHIPTRPLTCELLTKPPTCTQFLIKWVRSQIKIEHLALISC